MSAARLKKTALIFVGLVVLLLLALVVFRNTIIQQVAVSATAHSPFRIQELTIEQLGLREIYIKRLRAHSIEDTRETTVDVEGLLIEFESWTNLPGSIRTVSAKDGFVQIDVKSNKASQATEEVLENSASPVIEKWINLLDPVDANIERLEVVYSEDYKNLLFEMIGSVTKDGKQWLLDSNIGVLERFLGDVKFQLMSDGQYQLSVQDLEQQQSVIEIDGQFLLIDDGMQIAGTGEMHLSGLQALAKKSLPELADWRMDDTTNINFELQFPLVPSSLPDLLTGSIAVVSSGNLLHEANERVTYNLNALCQLQGALSQYCTFPEKLHVAYATENRPEPHPSALESVSLDLIPDEAFAVDLDWQKQSAQLNGGLRLTGSTVGPNGDFDLHLTELMARYSPENLSTHGNYSLQMKLAALNAPVGVRQAKLNLAGGFQWLEEAAQITANKDSTVSLAKLVIDKTELDAVHVQLKNQLTWQGDPTAWHMQPVKLSAKVTKLVQAGELLVTPGSGEVTLSEVAMSNAQINVSAAYLWKDIKAHAPKMTVPLQELAGSLSIRGNQVHTKGEVSFGIHKDKILYQTNIDTKAATGALQVTCSDLELKDNQTLNRLIASTGYPLSLDRGSLEFALRSRWSGASSPMQSHIDLKVRGAAGSYAQLPFEGFNVQAAFIGDEQWRLQEATKVKLQHAFFGVPVENVHIDISSLRFHADQQLELVVPQLGLDTLGGSVFANNIAFDSDKEENRVLLKLSNLSLEELVKYQKSKDLYLSGYLVGELPIVYSHGVVTVDDGNLSADESGGIIRYLNLEHLKAAKADLSIVSDMLKNFHYQALTANASLSPEGDVMLKTHLQGRNPDLETAEVNLNFNIEFNLPSALKTAKLLYFVDKDIEAYIRSRGKK